jgi:hypothetical protein
MKGTSSMALACDTKQEVEFGHTVVPALAQIGVIVVDMHHDERRGVMTVVLSVANDSDTEDRALEILAGFERVFGDDFTTSPTFVWNDGEGATTP